jgi:hypothetical protein
MVFVDVALRRLVDVYRRFRGVAAFFENELINIKFLRKALKNTTPTDVIKNNKRLRKLSAQPKTFMSKFQPPYERKKKIRKSSQTTAQ